MSDQTAINDTRPAARGSEQGLWDAVGILGVVTLFSLLSSSVLAVVIYWQAPVHEFVWVGPKQTGCVAVADVEPSVSQARIVEFAAQAAIATMNYDYFNFDAQMQSAMREYFTRNGGRRYLDELAGSGLSSDSLRSSGFVSVLSITRKTPNIAEEGRISGRYYWKVEVPVVVFYRSTTERVSESRLMTMTIIRTPPSDDNPNGIAVDGVTSVRNYDRELPQL